MNEKQQLAYDLALNGKSIFVSGAAGCGKSYVIEQIVRALSKKQSRYQICAPTGVAAVNVRGKTLHRYFGLKPWIKSIEQYLSAPRRKEHDVVRLDVLIIDEISMVSAEMFDLLDAICRLERGRKSAKLSAKPFGGLQLLIFGDFYQLPPVITDFKTTTKVYAFESTAWKALDLTTLTLTTVIRQLDEHFSTQLCKLRSGTVDDEVTALLDEISMDSKDRPDCIVDEKTLRLESLNVDKDSVNNLSLQREPGEEYVYQCQYTGDESLMRGCLAASELKLKAGCPIIHLANINGVYNGSTGIVVDPCPDKKTGRTGPLVHFTNHIRPMDVAPHTWEVNDDRGNVLATKTQIPVILAYSLSISKSQSLSIDKLQVNLSKVFCPGMSYTALSRARTKQGLTALGIRGKTKTQLQSIFAPDERVRTFYDKSE